MNKTTTHDTIIRYLYNETSKSENAEIKVKSLIDNNFYQELNELKIVKNLIDKTTLSPNRKTINSILSYAAW